MKTKDDPRYFLCLLLIIITSGTLLFSTGCRSLPSQHSDRGAEQKEQHFSLIPPYDRLDGVDLTATVRGEAHYQNERFKFKALLGISSSGKMRFEIFNPFGKMISAIIYSPPTISFYIPAANLLYRGEGSPENMFKLFGLKVEAQHILNLFSGMEPFLTLQNQGLFTAIMAQEGTFRKEVLLERELQSLVQRGGSLILEDPRGRELDKIAVLSHYTADSGSKTCFLILPKETTIDITDPFMILRIQLKEIKRYSLYADGNRLCGFHKENIDPERRDIFTDRQYEILPRTELINLNHIEVDKPLFLGE